MKSRMLFLLFLTVFVVSLSADYEGLKVYKAAVKNQPSLKKSTKIDRGRQLYIVNFKDINNMDTVLLDSKYGLKLYECIADGICIFKLDTNQTQPKKLHSIVQSESNINSIVEYLPYKFHSF